MVIGFGFSGFYQRCRPDICRYEEAVQDRGATLAPAASAPEQRLQGVGWEVVRLKDVLIGRALVAGRGAKKPQRPQRVRSVPMASAASASETRDQPAVSPPQRGPL